MIPDNECQQQQPVAELSIRLEQVKFVQATLAVVAGHVIQEEDDDIQQRPLSSLGFVHQEPVHVFLRSRPTIDRLRAFLRDNHAGNNDVKNKKNHKNATGRWQSLKDQDGRIIQLQMRIETVLTKAIERNRRGVKLLECQAVVAIFVVDDNQTSLPAPVRRSTPATTATASNNTTFCMYDKSQRHALFADWLLATYGHEFLSQGSGILDVAGGKGELSLALQARGIPSVVLDPHPRLLEKVDNVPVIALPLEGDGSHLLAESNISATTTTTNSTSTSFSCRTTSTSTAALMTTVQEQTWIRTCSMIVGMHPDQATDSILLLARRLQVPFAILPCCVMPTLFPHRVYQGIPVRSYRVFCQYLQSMYNDDTPQPITIKSDHLPFMGRNMILYTTNTDR